MAEFSSAQVLGGVVVLVGADLAPLRAGEREAKTIAMGIERNTRISIPVSLDTSRLRAELPRLVAATQAAVQSLPPIRLPVMLDLSGVRAQLATVSGLVGSAGGGGGAGWGGGPVRINIPNAQPNMLGGGFSPAGFLPAPGVVPPAQTVPGSSPSTGPMYGPNPRPWVGAGSRGSSGSSFGGGAPPIPPGAPGSPGSAWWQGPNATSVMGSWGVASGQYPTTGGAPAGGGFGRSVIGSVVTAEILNMSLRAGARAVGAYQDVNSSDPVRSGQGKLDMLSGLKALPLVGGSLAMADALSGYGAATERNLDSDKTRQGAVDAAPELRRALRNQVAALSGDPVAAARAEGDVAVRAAAKLMVDSQGASGKSELALATRIRNSEVGRAGGIEAARNRGALDRSEMAGFQVRSMQNMAAGDTEYAFELDRKAGRMGIQAGYREQIAGARGSERNRLGTAQRADLSVYDEQTEQQKADRQKRRVVDLYTAQASAAESTLRINKQTYAADLAAFDAATNAKLALIKDTAERQNEGTRRGAERSQIVARERQRLASSAADSAGVRQIAGLQIAGRDFDAEIASFEVEARQRREQFPQGSKEWNQQVTDDDQRMKALKARQGRDKANISDGLSARREQAGAFGGDGSYQNQVAGLMGVIAGMRSELKNSDPEFRKETADTQVMELQAERRRLLGPSRGGAREVDPLREGPGNNDEIPNLLRLIEKAIRETQNNGAVVG